MATWAWGGRMVSGQRLRNGTYHSLTRKQHKYQYWGEKPPIMELGEWSRQGCAGVNNCCRMWHKEQGAEPCPWLVEKCHGWHTYSQSWVTGSPGGLWVSTGPCQQQWTFWSVVRRPGFKCWPFNAVWQFSSCFLKFKVLRVVHQSPDLIHPQLVLIV